MKILLVEDDRSLIRGISFALKKDGFQVEYSDSLKEARISFDNGKFDLVLLDVNLPDGLGFDFCEEVRRYSDVPIIFLTAAQSELDIMNGLDIGGDDYIIKPFSVGVLISRVNAILRRTKKEVGSTVIISKDIKLYENKMKLEVGGKDIDLSKIEIKLVQYFMNNPQIILSKYKILSAIWDIEGDFVDENVVAVNIGRLRNKIEKDKSNPEYIQNIRGVGYIWSQGCAKQ
ncbi:response regulator transcription factor [Clostridium gasigenes]|uniref:response regulator transcription factor n=1 Tax=Clostridium gasigenes TaxID=94869 RepID=UPI001C0CF7B2|nr:response regulator transcription factor [Clostridium gasigenes]MBU3132077.1 response regulator transcription factor [Clostridium gasigenes]